MSQNIQNKHYRLSLKQVHNCFSNDFHLFDQHKIIYTSGKMIVIYNTQTNDYQVHPLNQKYFIFISSQFVYKIKLSCNKKYLIVIQKISKQIFCSTYILSNDNKQKEEDGKGIKMVKLDLEINWNIQIIATCQQYANIIGLLISQFNKKKILIIYPKQKKLINQFQFEIDIKCICFNPKSPHILAICGYQVFKILELTQVSFRITQQHFKKINLYQNFKQMEYIDEKNLLLMSEKQIHLINDKNEIQASFHFYDTSLISLKTYSKGFVVSTLDYKLQIWAKYQQKYKVYLYISLNLDRNSPIKGFQISPQQDFIYLNLKSRDFIRIPFDQINYDKFYQHENQRVKTVDVHYIFNNCGEIGLSKIALCRDKPLIAILAKNGPILSIYNLETQSYQAKRFFNMKYSTQLSVVHCITFHHNGYIVALGFTDKLRLYYLLHNDIYLFKQVNIRCIYYMQYSHRCQYLAVYLYRNKNHSFAIYETLKFQKIFSMKLTNQVLQIMWQHLDRKVIILTENGIYDIDMNTLEIPVVEQLQVSSMMIQPKNHKRLYINKNNNLLSDYSIKKGFMRLSNIKMNKIKTSGNMFFGVGMNGDLIFANNYNFDHYQTQNLHNGDFNILVNQNLKYVVTYDQNDYTINQMICLQGGQKEYAPKLTLIQKSTLQEYIKKFKALENQLQSLNNDILLKQEEQKKEMLIEREKYVQNANKELQDWANRFQQIRNMKISMQTDSINFFKALQVQHLKTIEELQKLYEGKLDLQKQKYIELEQKFFEERMLYQHNLKQLQLKHQQQIKIIREMYQKRICKLQLEFQLSKSKTYKIKQDLQEIQYQIEEEYQKEIREKNVNNQRITDQLRNKLAITVNNYEEAVAKTKTVNEDVERYKIEVGKKQHCLGEIKLILQQYKNKIQCLQKQRTNTINILKQRQQTIKQLNQKIADIKKSKHVLSFRTTQMRKQLEPKEQQIEKLKEELFRLQFQLEKISKQQFLEKEKTFKMEKQLETFKKQNTKFLMQNKQKQQWINKIVLDIHNLVNKDQKQWPKLIIQLYHSYVKGRQIKKIDQDKNIQLELNRHLVHLQKTLNQVSESNKKQVIWRDYQVAKKLKENADLLFDLNNLRRKNDQYQKELKIKNQELKNLKKQLTQQRPLTTGDLYKRTIRRTDYLNNQSMLVEVTKHDHVQMKTDLKDSFYSYSYNKKQKHIQNKGTLKKGSNFDLIKISQIDRAKMFDFMTQIQIYRKRISELEQFVKQLKSQLKIEE